MKTTQSHPPPKVCIWEPTGEPFKVNECKCVNVGGTVDHPIYDEYLCQADGTWKKIPGAPDCYKPKGKHKDKE